MTSRIASYLAIGGLLLTLSGCNTVEPAGGKAAADKPSGMASAIPTSAGPDGTLPLPADYKSWPKFLTDIPKGEAKQVRDIYINPTGARTSAGQNFPNGTVMVMEIYKAKMDGDKLITGMDGKPAKGDLAKVFVMGKEQGWGDKLPENLKNGDWAYAAYDPSSKPLMEDFTKCRACHTPLAQKDFVHRYDEYFQTRGRM
jgi:Cytochrome P460